MSEMLLCLQTVSNVIAVGTSHGLALVFGKHVSVLCAVVVKLIKGTTVEFYFRFLEGMYVCLIITVCLELCLSECFIVN